MELIKDVLESRKEINRSIKKYGFTPEHHFPYYLNEETPSKKNIFIKFNRGMGILAQRSNTGIWYTISEVLAPKEKRAQLYLEFLDYAFDNKSKKVKAEFGEEFKNILLGNKTFLKKYKFYINETYYWPIFEMKKWDGDKLEGKRWKKLRNTINRLKKNYKIDFKNHDEFSTKQLNNIVKEWIKNRPASDRANPHLYYNVIKNNFEGFDSVRIMTVDNEPCTITAGWKYGKNSYYSNMGILNYKHKGIGELSNWDDLVFLKKKNFKIVDFGGSGKALLEFKMKFKPHSIYKTYVFYIHKK